MGIQNPPRMVRFSVHIYGMLLPAYPRSFREAYGSQMVQVFGDTCLRIYNQKGVPGLFPLWIETLMDFVKTVIEEHLQKESAMSKDTLTRLTGWFLILAGFSSMFFSIRSFYFSYYEVTNNLYSPESLQLFDSILYLALELALIWLVFFGFYGVYKLYKNILGKLAPVSITFIFIGALLNTLNRITIRLDLHSLNFEILGNSVPGFLAAFGTIGFGAVLAKHKPLPKMNYIILITFLMPFLLIPLLNILNLNILDLRGPMIFIPIIAIPPIGRIILGTILLSNLKQETSSGQSTPLATTS